VESDKSEARLFDFLESLSIKTYTHRHAPVFTVAEAQAARIALGEHAEHGGHSKNLFIRDKKKRSALLVVDEDTRVNLKALGSKLGMGRLSFASPERLLDMLGVTPGSVTPFALVNRQVAEDAEAPLLVALDAALMKKAPLFFHPLHNAATTAIAPEDFLRFIEGCGYSPLLLDLDENGSAAG